MKIFYSFFALLCISMLLLLISRPVMASGRTKRDITFENDLVGICYSTWFNPVVKKGMPIYNISEILKKNPDKPKWGPLHAFHYWAKPALGYYRSDDAEVIKKHVKLLNEAKIDFIIIDNTNMREKAPDKFKREMMYEPFKVLLNTLKAIRKTGESTPNVVIWSPSEVAMDMYRRFYSNPEYVDLFLYWNDGNGLKPFFLTTDKPGEKVKEKFTVRKMWGLQGTLADKEWSYLQIYPQKVGMNKNKIEQISVSPAMQETYMTAPTAHGRKGGRTFQKQWQRAFKLRPKIITITWWNEWIAQRFEINGKTMFVDDYNREFSRDIEPMAGGHGDLYYNFMKRYIKAYKKHEKFPNNLLEPSSAPNKKR